MNSQNPILNRVEMYATPQDPMTIGGAIQKTVILTSVASAFAVALFFFFALTGNAGAAGLASIIGIVVSFILALVVTFKPQYAPTLGIPYALFEGCFLAGVSYYYQAKFPGVPMMALLATVVTAGVMLALYKARIIRATEKFKSVVISATIAIAIVFVLQIILSLVFSSTIPGLFENTWLGIGFAAFVAIIASLNLILDFDLVENFAAQSAPKYTEWLCGISILAALVWMYISFLRLIGFLSSDD